MEGTDEVCLAAVPGNQFAPAVQTGIEIGPEAVSSVRDDQRAIGDLVVETITRIRDVIDQANHLPGSGPEVFVFLRVKVGTPVTVGGDRVGTRFNDGSVRDVFRCSTDVAIDDVFVAIDRSFARFVCHHKYPL